MPPLPHLLDPELQGAWKAPAIFQSWISLILPRSALPGTHLWLSLLLEGLRSRPLTPKQHVKCLEYAAAFCLIDVLPCALLWSRFSL